MKRFYREVSVFEGENGSEVRLDGRVIHTPARAPLCVPTHALASAIATEWREQGDTIRPATMPLTQFANTTLDLTGKHRPEVVAQITAYTGTDLVCYRADHPAPLAAREREVWQPLLDWLAVRFDAFLRVGSGIMPQPQPAEAHQALHAAVTALDDWHLTALQLATTAAGSLVIGLALIEGRLTGEQAFEASQLHESFEIERWGEDAEATKRRAALTLDLAALQRFVRLLDENRG